MRRPVLYRKNHLIFLCTKLVLRNTTIIVRDVVLRTIFLRNICSNFEKRKVVYAVEGYSISFTLGKASADHGGNVNHNNRDFTANNVIKEKSKDNIQYRIQNIEDAFHELFDDAVEEYNKKQTRPCRCIDNYFEHINKSKREEIFYEAVVQFGNVDDSPCGSKRGEIAKQMLDEYMKDFQKRNPNLYVFNAVLHMDEASPHIHIDFIPFYTNGRSKGLSKGVSMRSALDEQGFKASSKMNNRLVAWEASERKAMEDILISHGFARQDKNAHHKHMSVEEYKWYENERSIQSKLKEERKVISSDISKENVLNLKQKLASANKKISDLKKEKSSPHKSFFYSNPDKQSFIQSKMDAANIPYVETENGFDAQECYVEQIRQWEKDYKSSSKSFRDKLIDDIDRLLMQCNDVEELYKKLQDIGYTIKFGKYISVRPPKAERFIRLKSLGEEYNERALQNRIQSSIKFENKLNENIERAKTENSPAYKTLSTIRFYTVTFKKGLLPCRKKYKHQPFSWTNDEELDKLLLLNKKINQGATIQSMKDEFAKLENELHEKNEAVVEVQKKVQRLSKGQEAFEVLYEGKISDTISKEEAGAYQKRYPNINADNYQQVIEIADAARHEQDSINEEIKNLEKEVRELSNAISIAEQVQADTYIQELVSKENIHRNADVLPNGVFQL